MTQATMTAQRRMSAVFITRHALDRYREVWPGIGIRGVLRKLARSECIDRQIVAPFLGRRLEAVRDEYWLAHDLTGLFVIVECPVRGPYVVTFIRFGAKQREVAARLWPKRVAA